MNRASERVPWVPDSLPRVPRGGQGGANCPRASRSIRGSLKAGNSNLKTEF